MKNANLYLVNKEEKLDLLFYALSDQTRRRMLDRLSGEDALSLKELGVGFELTKQAISKHIKVLEKAGLISKEKDGRVQRCSFHLERLELIQKKIESYREFWNKQFDQLDEYIEKTKEKK